jgi:serine/threonine-protein phosphatase 2A catalytic subunit
MISQRESTSLDFQIEQLLEFKHLEENQLRPLIDKVIVLIT